MLAESGTVELKREYVEAVKKTVIAFANCQGGTVYIGVEDDGSVRGVADPAATLAQVAAALRDAVRPDVMLFVELGSQLMDGKQVVTVTVQRGTARPYYLSGKGLRPEGVYVRQGTATVPASEAAILSMIKETSGDSYEEARSLNQELTFAQAAAVFHKKGLKFGPQQRRTLQLLGKDGAYTNLALLLSDQCPHTIKLAVFQGSKKTVFKDRRELTGSLLAQLEAAMDFLGRYNRVRAEFQGLNRIDCLDYPVEAVREALLNAIIHRDYSYSGSTLVSVFDDRLEFVSLGGLVRGLSFDDILLGVSSLRNQYLANVFYRLDLIEAYGTGILKIQECYQDYPVKPLIQTSSHAFKLTLPNVNYQKEGLGASPRQGAGAAPARPEQEERGRAVLRLCQQQGSLVRRDVERELKLSQSTAVLLLRRLVAEGLLEKRGGARNLRYYLAGAGQAAAR